MKRILILVLFVVLLSGCAEKEQDGMTIEVMVDGVSYTFACSMQGDIIGVGRTDGERFDLRGE